MSALTGTPILLRTAAHQNARIVAPWTLAVTALSVTSLIGYRFVFADEASRQGLAMTIGSNPAFNLLFGTPYDLLTEDGFNAWRSLALGGFFTGLMAIILVVRNTRADEDSGQAELIASSVVGRHARLAAAVQLAFAASIIVGLVSAIVTMLFGGDPSVTIALSTTFTATGFMFAGVAAVAAQVGSYARTASTLAITVLGASFLIRGFADAAPGAGWLIWWTPMGWTQEVRPSTEARYWPLLICLAFTLVMVAIANGLLARRDYGQGLVPARPGPPRGRGLLTNVWGLALRLQAPSIVAWSIAFLILGGAFGYLASSLGDVIGPDSPFAKAFASSGQSIDLAFAFVLILLQIMGIIAAVYGVQVMMRVYAEEIDYRLEPPLAASLARWQLLASHAVIAILGPATALLIGGVAISLTATDPALTTGNLVRQVLAEIPAVAILVGVSVATIGARPQVRLASWAAVVATFALTILGPLFNLWDWILGISPLWHVPNVTDPDMSVGSIVGLVVVAAGFVTIGFLGFRRRDVR